MKLFRISLAIIISLLLTALVCPSVQADEESGSVDLSATGSLTISDVSASSIRYYEATISWNTNGGATSQVFYDTEFHEDIADYAHRTTEDTTLVSEHSIRLTGLTLSTTYHYRVRSAIDTEFIAISGDYTFATATPPPPTPTVGGGGFARRRIPPGTTDVRGEISWEGVFEEPVTAISEDELCTLTIPEGTVGLTSELERLREITMVIMDELPPPPEDAHLIGLAYDLGPDGATFDPPITLEYTYDPDDIPEDVAEEGLVIAYYDEANEEWVELDCVVDTENKTITAEVSHFTTFAIIAPVAPVPPPEEVVPPEEEEEVVPPEEVVAPEAPPEEVVPPPEEVAPPEEVVPPEEEVVPPVKPPFNWPLVGGIIGGVVVVTLLVFFLVVRRRA